MAHNMDWPRNSFEPPFSTQFIDGTDPPMQHLGGDQFTNYQIPQSSPTGYTEMTNVTSPYANGDVTNVTSPYANGDVYSTAYMPTSQPAYDGSMASALPDLSMDMVNEVLKGESSIDKLSLGENGIINQLTPHQQIALCSSYPTRLSGSMSSGSGSGSMTNGLNFTDMVGTNMPADGVDAAPHRIEILEEPMEFGYRFRYEVEGKAHGGLQGQSSKNGSSSKRGNKIYPEIQVCNVPSHINEVEIEARLVSATEDYFPHPNRCSGKDCNDKGIFRKVLKRNEHPEFRLTLNNLTVLQIKKGDQKQSLHGQLVEINEQQKRMRRNGMISDVEKKAGELAKAKHNGVVRIRFQAAYYDSQTGIWQVACKHSTSVHDQKQTNAAELRICRVSVSSSPASGGAEVYLLCEKVTKDDIKVKFRHDKWEADGDFQGTDVHYQFAIVFRAPPYKKQDIKNPVDVELMLFRPSTGTYSRALTFTYYPEKSVTDEVFRKKRKIHDSAGPSGMDGYPPYSQNPFDGNQRPSSNGGGGGGGSYNFPPVYSNPGYNYKKEAASSAESSPKGAEELPMDLSKNNSCPATIEDVEADSTSVKQEPTVKVEATDDNDSKQDSECEDVEADGAPMKVSRAPAPVLLQPLVKANEYDDDVKQTEELMASLKIGEKVAEETKGTSLEPVVEDKQAETIAKSHMQDHISVCEDLVIDSLMNYAVTGDHLYFISQFRYFLAVKDQYGDNSVHMAVINGQAKALKDMLSICAATKTTAAINQLNDKQQTPIHLATILRNTEMVHTLITHEADPTIADSAGSNCFHTAAKNKDFKTMEVLCRWFASNSKDRMLLDARNYKGVTALHNAVTADSIECVRELLNSGADVDIGDGTSGKTALHYTVQRANIVTASELILCGKADTNAMSYDGNTPLHLAVCLKNEDMTKLLVKSGADPESANRQVYEDENGEEIMGMTAFDLCQDDPRMVNVIDRALEKGAKPQSTLSDTIHSLPHDTMESLSTLLDKQSQDWKRLAQYFELQSLIPFMEDKPQPNSTLLRYLAENDKTVRDLKSALASIGRQDCIALIERAFVLHNVSQARKKTNPRNPSIKDSGFDDCTSENLKSELYQQ